MNVGVSCAAPATARAHARAQPRLYGERLLSAGDALFTRLDRLIARFVAPEYSPLAQAGAIANTSLLVACASGVVLLFWYRTSVHAAYASIASVDASPAAHFVRSLHRYSSDAALLFALIHAAREVSAGRLGRVRWLAWVTGLASVLALWFVGFLGYWLVWDVRGQAVALASARLLDRLPIFSDPLSRSFLADELLSSLLFFVVFFLHMLIPLAMGIGLFLHITRLSRPAFLTRRALTLVLLGAMSALAVVAPADLAAPAKMAVRPGAFALDAWFLWPIPLGERLGVGATWAIIVFLGSGLVSVPWILTRRRPSPARVVTERCNGCERCYRDCPYDAIRMVARSDDRPYSSVAVVDPDQCLGCGICAGACDSAAIGLDWFDSLSQRESLDRRIAAMTASEPGVSIAFVCAEAAPSAEPGRAAGASELPGFEVVSVPCAGWVHPLLAERALRRGASRVLVAACAPGNCAYREGSAWTSARFAGERQPALRRERVRNGVKLVQLYRHERGRPKREARDGEPHRAPPSRPTRRIAAGVFAVAAAVTLAGSTWAGTRVAYRPRAATPLFVISLKAAGEAKNACRALTDDEKKRLPIHMQGQTICERGRADLRLHASIDGQELLRRSYTPRGVWNDGNSVAIESIPVEPGEHSLAVEIGDSSDPHEFHYRTERAVRFEPGRQVSLLFDQSKAFRWY